MTDLEVRLAHERHEQRMTRVYLAGLAGVIICTLIALLSV